MTTKADSTVPYRITNTVCVFLFIFFFFKHVNVIKRTINMRSSCTQYKLPLTKARLFHDGRLHGR